MFRFSICEIRKFNMPSELFNIKLKLPGVQ
jgi:hypothetical protein